MNKKVPIGLGMIVAGAMLPLILITLFGSTSKGVVGSTLFSSSMAPILIVGGVAVFLIGLRSKEKEKEKEKMAFGKKQRMRTMTQEDIDRGLEEVFKGQRKPEQRFAEVEERESIKRAGGSPRLSFEPEPEPEPEDEQPYWSGEEWEQWAYSMYKNYPETRKFLPDWFLEALSEAIGKK